MAETKLIAEFFDQNWKKVEVLITDKAILWEKNKIDFKEVIDLEIVRHAQKDCIRIRREKDYYFSFGDRQKQVFRFIAFNIKSD
ncbi:MAG: hypothetical protein NZ872_06700, partial [Archaeoglobaceae archaeon]|nr:hypothetical protein [Archaeoglobaceae archaeon]MDW8128887.1 hypothetical protein [Archaeoglobaceae archaeon]